MKLLCPALASKGEEKERENEWGLLTRSIRSLSTEGWFGNILCWMGAAEVAVSASVVVGGVAGPGRHCIA